MTISIHAVIMLHEDKYIKSVCNQSMTLQKTTNVSSVYTKISKRYKIILSCDSKSIYTYFISRIQEEKQKFLNILTNHSWLILKNL